MVVIEPALFKIILKANLDVRLIRNAQRLCFNLLVYTSNNRKVQVGNDKENAQSEKDSHSKKPRWEKTKLTIRYLYHENIS